MQTTVTDFWTMIWENKSHTIVMLGQLEENEEVSIVDSTKLIMLTLKIGILIQVLA